MHSAPSQRTLLPFALCLLLPTVGLPALILLGSLAHGVLGLAALTVYAVPPLFLAELLGSCNSSLGGTYSSALFQGYIGIGPTFPLGFLFCTFVWAVIGYILWFLIWGLRAKGPRLTWRSILAEAFSPPPPAPTQPPDNPRHRPKPGRDLY